LAALRITSLFSSHFLVRHSRNRTNRSVVNATITPFVALKEWRALLVVSNPAILSTRFFLDRQLTQNLSVRGHSGPFLLPPLPPSATSSLRPCPLSFRWARWRPRCAVSGWRAGVLTRFGAGPLSPRYVQCGWRDSHSRPSGP